MIQIRVKIIPGVGQSDGSWELINFDDFLLQYSPSLASHIYCTKQFPPMHIINEELRTGGREMGMSGGCIWKQFQLSQIDYVELREELLTNPNRNLNYDDDFDSEPTIKKWCYATYARYNPHKN